jgi:lipopolysaccharide/colanic/teichoic acid biosynthesis glycosyltransferase
MSASRFDKSSTFKPSFHLPIQFRRELMATTIQRIDNPSVSSLPGSSSSRWYPPAKRAFDLLVAMPLFLCLWPLFVLAATLVKLTDFGPVLFWQRRVGLNGREFWCPKFRSMVIDAEQRKASLLTRNDHKEGITFKMKSDPRVTWIGHFLRKSSIDELPQLLCVLTGDMSLVGPRPPVPEEVARYTQADRRRLVVVPGLTCLWQVSGRGDLPFAQQVTLDTQYIERRSFWLDLKILLRTIPAVLSGRGAY